MKKDEFILALRQALISQNTSDIDEIISDFEDHFAAALQEGKTEEEITEMLGQPEMIAEQYPAVVNNNFSEPADDPTNSNRQNVFNQSTSQKSSFQSAAKTGNNKNPAKNYINNNNNIDSNGNDKRYVRVEDNSAPAAGVQSAPVSESNLYQSSIQQQQSPTINHGRIDPGKVTALVLINLFIMIPLLFTIFGILIGFWSASIGIGIGGAALFAAAALQQGVQVQILILFGISLTALCLLLLIASYHLTKASILGIIKYIRWNGTWVKER